MNTIEKIINKQSIIFVKNQNIVNIIVKIINKYSIVFVNYSKTIYNFSLNQLFFTILKQNVNL